MIPIQKIALVEIGNSHSECLLTQIYALQNDFEIVLILNQELYDQSEELIKLCNSSIAINTKDKSSMQIAGMLWKLLRINHIEKAIFNTAQGNVIRKLAIRALGYKIEFIGLIHTVRKFQGSFTQKIINLKIKKYFVLSEHLLHKINPPRGVKVECFYPIDFLQFETQSEVNQRLRIGIIGGVESRRKDIEGFLQMTENVNDIDFYFIGKTDFHSKYYALLRHRENVKVFTEFLSQKDFHTEVSECDFILPLVHPHTPSADQYFTNQISGATTVAFGYKIPLLIHEAYKNVEDVQGCSVFYSLENFRLQLESAIQIKDELKENIQHKYNSKEQQQKFLMLINA